jgi:glycerol-3-phosphate dehydrogenase (NAD(P)+)
MEPSALPGKNYRNIAVIGAGAWGTALALAAARAGCTVTLWAREPDVVSAIAATGQNARFLPDVPLPRAIAPTGDLQAAAASGEAVLLVCPAQHVRASLVALAPHLAPGTPLLLCAKGIEQGTGRLLTEVVAECAPGADPAILSGPSFARDVALGLPTAVTIAARKEVAFGLLAALGHAAFRPYASEDLTGVALGGAAKNVYAIGCGIVAGMGLGDSARAALLTRSFAELCRLGAALGARTETLAGLSGLGDLVLTATSASSRNYRFGFRLGAGEPLAALRAPGEALAEGVDTAPALLTRAAERAIELPVAEAIADILAGRLGLADALPRLMTRPLRAE